MYNPEEFRVSDRNILRNFVREYTLGILISCTSGEIVVSHIPFLINDECTELLGHMAILNHQAETVNEQDVTVIFQGPSHYISPVWYRKEYTVPTWNYVAVHIRGKATLFNERNKIMKVMNLLTHQNERKYGENWFPDWNDDQYVEMVNHVAGIQVAIKDIEGKWKLGQTQPEINRAHVAEKLAGLRSRDAEIISRMMTDTIKK